MIIANAQWTAKTAENGTVYVSETSQQGGETTIATFEDFQTAALITLTPPMLRALFALQPLLNPGMNGPTDEDFSTILTKLIACYDNQIEPILQAALAENILSDITEVQVYSWRFNDESRTTRGTVDPDRGHAPEGWSIINIHRSDPNQLAGTSGEEDYDDYESAIIAATKRARRFNVEVNEL